MLQYPHWVISMMVNTLRTERKIAGNLSYLRGEGHLHDGVMSHLVESALPEYE